MDTAVLLVLVAAFAGRFYAGRMAAELIDNLPALERARIRRALARDSQ